jgi:hypothetical protein
MLGLVNYSLQMIALWSDDDGGGGWLQVQNYSSSLSLLHAEIAADISDTA